MARTSAGQDNRPAPSLAVGALLALATAGCSTLAGLDDYGGPVASGGGAGTVATGGSGGSAGGVGNGGAGVGGGGGAIYQELVTASNPMAYWTFDEIRAGDAVALDEQGAFDLSLSEPWDVAPGLIADSPQALSFPIGGGEAFNTADALGFFGTAPFSFDLWFEDRGDTKETILGRGAGTMAEGYVLTLTVENAERRISLERFQAGLPDRAIAPILLQVGEAYHVLATYDQVCLCLFVIGGSPVTSAVDCVDSGNVIQPTNVRFRIGHAGLTGFAGPIDEVAVYSSAIAVEDFVARHTAAAGAPPPFATTSCAEPSAPPNNL